MPTHHKIKIKVEDNGTFTYKDQGNKNAKYKRTKSTDTISWICEDGPFAIAFDSKRSPLDPNVPWLGAKMGAATTTLPIKHVPPGTDDPHDYSVAVYIEAAEKVLVDDPQIIVTNDGMFPKKTAAKK